MSGQIRQEKEASTDVYPALRDTREGGYSYISVSATTEFVRCP